MGANKPRVSIGLPVYNGEQYLEAAIESILTQTFADFELIISDNASVDRTQEICKAYAAKDRRIRYYRNESNLGATQNYNRVFELSTGEYFKWAAHDDICQPEYLERCVEVLDRKPSVVLCYPRTTLIDESGKFVENYPDNFKLDSPEPHARYKRYHNRFRRGGALCNPVFGVIRANVLQRTPLIGNYPSSDKILLGELALLGEVYEVPEYLFWRRDHPQRSWRACAGPNRQATFAALNQLATWFDPAHQERVQLPRFRWLLEHLAAVKRVPMSWHGKAYCYVEVGKWAWHKKKLLAEDLKNLAVATLRRPVILLRSRAQAPFKGT